MNMICSVITADVATATSYRATVLLFQIKQQLHLLFILKTNNKAFNLENDFWKLFTYSLTCPRTVSEFEKKAKPTY